MKDKDFVKRTTDFEFCDRMRTCEYGDSDNKCLCLNYDDHMKGCDSCYIYSGLSDSIPINSMNSYYIDDKGNRITAHQLVEGKLINTLGKYEDICYVEVGDYEITEVNGIPASIFVERKEFETIFKKDKFYYYLLDLGCSGDYEFSQIIDQVMRKYVNNNLIDEKDVNVQKT